MARDFAELRREYLHTGLEEAGAHDDPLCQFQDWFQHAVAMEIEMANAMVLATVGSDGRPSARYVLLKGFDSNGFIFYSHADSTKGRQLGGNPHAALVFYWAPVHRQVRIEGTVGQMTAAEADAYFDSRPYDSRVSVWVAPQSSVVASREFMEERYAELEREFHGGRVPRPETWTGYRLSPATMEFWQGRESRLHDRLLYTRQQSGDWSRQRLAP